MKAFTRPNVISGAVSDNAAEDHRDDVALAFRDRAGRRTRLPSLIQFWA